MRFESCHQTLASCYWDVVWRRKGTKHRGPQQVIHRGRGTDLRSPAGRTPGWGTRQQDSSQLWNWVHPHTCFPSWSAQCGQFLLCHPNSRPIPFFLIIGSNHNHSVPSFEKKQGTLENCQLGPKGASLYFIAALILQIARVLIRHWGPNREPGCMQFLQWNVPQSPLGYFGDIPPTWSGYFQSHDSWTFCQMCQNLDKNTSGLFLPKITKSGGTATQWLLLS